MIYITKSQENDLYLNINNSSDTSFSTYTLTFKHILSQETTSYEIDTSNPAVYSGNTRYCIILLDLTTTDLHYLGQYELNIYGNGTELVYTGMVILEGDTEPSTEFIEYSSNNELGENYIYIN